ncbi:MAG: hypothetical protein Q8Q60_04525 [Candidatus Chromulinivorax sp.]|nr:hypothetical protein [Candidatus Chromulinivorax sp.]
MMNSRFGLISMMILLVINGQPVFASEEKNEKSKHRRTMQPILHSDDFEGGIVLDSKDFSPAEKTLWQRMHNVNSQLEESKNNSLSIEIPSEKSSPYSNSSNEMHFKRHSQLSIEHKSAWPEATSSRKNYESKLSSDYISSSDSEDDYSDSQKIQDSKHDESDVVENIEDRDL